MEKEKTYNVVKMCANCGKMQCFTIPFGMSQEEYFKKNKCPLCGCDCLGRVFINKRVNKYKI